MRVTQLQFFFNAESKDKGEKGSTGKTDKIEEAVDDEIFIEYSKDEYVNVLISLLQLYPDSALDLIRELNYLQLTDLIRVSNELNIYKQDPDKFKEERQREKYDKLLEDFLQTNNLTSATLYQGVESEDKDSFLDSLDTSMLTKEK